MKNSRNSFLPLTAYAAIMLLTVSFSSFASAQDDDGERSESSIQSRVDSIVQRTFRRVDQEFGTYIFMNEPEPERDTHISINTDDDESIIISTNKRRHSSSSYSYSYSGYSSPQYGNNSVFTAPWDYNNDHLLVGYNRVQGLFLGLAEPKSSTWNRHHIEFFGSGGYGFAEHRWRYNGGAAEQFGLGNHMVELGGEGHSLTDTDDRWIVGQRENDLAAFIARDDYHDYFGRQGYSAWIGFSKRPSATTYRLQATFLSDQYASLDRATNWSVFGGEKLFRDNPAINEGTMHSILTSLDIRHMYEGRFFTTGWAVSASAELTPAGSGDFQFRRYLVDVRRYQPFGSYDNLNIRIRAGSATGNLPLQKILAVGGISTLPAFSYKEFAGNRLLLANAEYVVNGRMFDDDDVFPSWLMRNINFVIFIDAGYAGVSSTSSPIQGFDLVNSSTVRSDYGFAIATRDAKARLGFAWRTDLAERPHIFLRLERPF